MSEEKYIKYVYHDREVSYLKSRLDRAYQALGNKELLCVSMRAEIKELKGQIKRLLNET